MANILIKNIGTLVSGDIHNPVLAADGIFVADGRIQKIGTTAELASMTADTVVDAKGAPLRLD